MITLIVPDMTCGGCAKAVTNIVKTANPAAAVDIDVATKKVTISNADDENAIREALADGGFPAQ